MVTPFTPALEVDYDRAAELAVKLVEQGNDGLVVFGTTGESPTLSFEEKINLLKTVRRAVGPDVPVIAGTGSNNTAASVKLSQAAAEAGASGFLLVAPYYNKPSQEGLYKHFKTIAEATNLPVILYNIPGRSNIEIKPDTLVRLSEIPQVIAVKEAIPTIDPISELRYLLHRADSHLDIYSGDDSNTLAQLAVGGYGVISVAGHLVAKELKKMIESFIAGEVEAAESIHRRLFPLFKVLFITTNPVPVKAALKLLGFPVGSVRLPLVAATAEQEAEIEAVLQQLNLI